MDYAQFEEQNEARVIELLEESGDLGGDPHDDTVGACYDSANPKHKALYDRAMDIEWDIYRDEHERC